MRRLLYLNTTTSIILQLVTVVCGFILPRMILVYFGSEVNGAIQSITQFLSAIMLAEFGVGQVIKSSLYKPLAENNLREVSEIVTSGARFFRKIGLILVAYVICLTFVYPKLVYSDFEVSFYVIMILILSLGTFAQYFLGLIDGLILNADQRGYIQNISQIIAVIINLIISVVLIKNNCGIQIVKLIASTTFVLRPIIVHIYVNKLYNINRKISYVEEPIKQKWNGIAQHISAFILGNTDIIVLTVFSSLSNVSVYAVYSMIITGIHNLYKSVTLGLHSLVGNLWARQEIEKLEELYGYIEVVLHMSIVFLFTCTGVLIIPFVRIYTNGVTDANYLQMEFAILLIIAHAFEGLKTIYNMMILGGGHYKQTQKCHIVAAILNFVLSIILVNICGLIGVAIGTLIAMVYMTVWMAVYDSKNLIKWPIKNFVKQIFVDIITVIAICIATMWIELDALTYVAWFVMAVKIAVIAAIVVLLMSYIFYKDKCKALFSIIMRRK